MNRRHLVWAIVGLVLAPLLLLSGKIPFAVGLLVAIGALFPLWKRYGGREVWIGIALGSSVMTAVLAWSAVTGAGCPDPGTVLQLQEHKPPVTCEEIRASYRSMAAFFGATMLLGLAMPVAARRRARRVHG